MITLNALDKGEEVGTSFMVPFDTFKHTFITCKSKCQWLFFQCHETG